MSGVQKFYCKGCGKYQQSGYGYKAYDLKTDTMILRLVRNGCGIRGITRVLEISAGTVMKRILKIAEGLKAPELPAVGGTYEIDELKTFIGCKANECWVAVAMHRESGSAVSVHTGRRTKDMLSKVVNVAMGCGPQTIYTDGLNIYGSLIPKSVHRVTEHGTRCIERFHLTLRTMLKRLSRKTICFSRSKEMLHACVQISVYA